MREQRKFMRVELSLPVDCFAVDAQGVSGPAIRATLVDLSAGGARLLLDGPVPLGAAMRLQITCAEPSLAISVLGTAVRSLRREAGGFDLGVRFVALPQEQRVALTRFVLAHARATGQRSAPVTPAAA